jgi:long-chain acyl-CoA synthetase
VPAASSAARPGSKRTALAPPLSTMNLAHLLARSARVFPERPALAHGEHEICSYRELAQRVAAIAGGLRTTLGLSAGDRVALYMANCPQYLELLYGIWHAGLIAVPINHKLHAREVAYILADSQASVLFVAAALDEAQRAAFDELRELAIVAIDTADYAEIAGSRPLDIVARAPTDLAWLFYTSGTTGRPKGVMLSHRNLLAMTLAYFPDVDQATAEDSTLYAAPMSHGAGMYNFPHVLVGARHVVPASGAFDPAEIIALAQRFGRVSCLPRRRWCVVWSTTSPPAAPIAVG